MWCNVHLYWTFILFCFLFLLHLSSQVGQVQPDVCYSQFPDWNVSIDFIWHFKFGLLARAWVWVTTECRIPASQWPVRVGSTGPVTLSEYPGKVSKYSSLHPLLTLQPFLSGSGFLWSKQRKKSPKYIKNVKNFLRWLCLVYLCGRGRSNLTLLISAYNGVLKSGLTICTITQQS